MKLITIWLINKCNYDCTYCVAKPGLEPMEFNYPNENVVSRNSNALLLPWLDKWLDPDEWLIELTGGEPGLYPEIDTLIPALTQRGYRGVIQTNGSLPIPESPNFVRTAAWHGDKRPKYYDSMIIIKAPDSGFEEKAEWCKANQVPYRLTELNGSYKGEHSSETDPNPCVITHYAFMNAYGQLTHCHRGAFREDNCIREMSPPPYFELSGTCPSCGNTKAVEYALETSLFPPPGGNTCFTRFDKA